MKTATPGFNYFVNEELAKELLEAESVCYSKGQKGLPESLLLRLKYAFPELIKQYSWLPMP